MKYIEHEVGNYPHSCNVEEITSNLVGALNIFHACPHCKLIWDGYTFVRFILF